MLDIEELSYQDRATVIKARRLERFLTQPFFVSQQFTGQSGKFVPLTLTIEGCERILADEFTGISEKSLYLISALDDISVEKSGDD